MATPREAVNVEAALDMLPAELLEIIILQLARDDVADAARLMQCCRWLNTNVWSLDISKLIMELVGDRLLPSALLADASGELAREAQESAPAGGMALDDVLKRAWRLGTTKWSRLPPFFDLHQAKRMQDLHRAVSELAEEASWDLGLDLDPSETERARAVQSFYSREHFRSLSRALSHCGHNIHELGAPGREAELDAMGCGLSDAQIRQAFHAYKWSATVIHDILTRRSTIYRERRCCNDSADPSKQDSRWNSVLECCNGTAALAWELESRYLVGLVRYDKTAGPYDKTAGPYDKTAGPYDDDDDDDDDDDVFDDTMPLVAWAQDTSAGDPHAHLLPHLLPLIGLYPSACRGRRPTITPTSPEPYPMDMVDFLWGFTADLDPILRYIERERLERESRIPVPASVLGEAIVDPRMRQGGRSYLSDLLFAMGQDGTHLSFRPCQSIYNFGHQGLFSRLLYRRRQMDEAGVAWGSGGECPVFKDRDSGLEDFLHWQGRPAGPEESVDIAMWDRRRLLLEYPQMPPYHTGATASG